MSVFGSIQDGNFLRSIAKATSRLVYRVPSVSPVIAEAIKIQLPRAALQANSLRH